MASTEWFASWFDSPWYPILYRHRDHREAEAFIGALLRHLNAPPGAQFLDLACGRGRHSRFIHEQGYQVLGLDLSPASIADAQAFAAQGLRFGVHDMRDPFPGNFDYILNLFTSFGYFSDQRENLKVLRNVKAALRPGGSFVLDFMNADRALRLLVPEEEQEVDEKLRFAIRRRVENGIIVKEIKVILPEEEHRFEERVQALTEADFKQLFEEAGLNAVECWGDYAGNAYNPQDSPRMIWFCQSK